MKRFNENIPIYIQLRDEIEKAIISGAIPEGGMVPSIRRIAQDYRLNPQTVSNALSELLTEDIIYKKRGVGFFVKEQAKMKLKNRKAKIFRENELASVIKKGKTLGVKKNEFIEVLNEIYEKGEHHENGGN